MKFQNIFFLILGGVIAWKVRDIMGNEVVYRDLVVEKLVEKEVEVIVEKEVKPWLKLSFISEWSSNSIFSNWSNKSIASVGSNNSIVSGQDLGSLTSIV